jgi:simple sugar transport system permease protein
MGIPLLALAISALLFAVFVALAGADPLGVYQRLYVGGFGTWFSWQNTLTRAAPLMLAALATALPARAGLLIIGGDGAVIAGGLAAAAAALAVGSAPTIVVQAAMFAAGALAGGAWMGVAGLLRLYRGVNETISSLLMNYLAITLLLHMVGGPMRDPASLNKPSTGHIGREVMVGGPPGVDVHWGLAAGVVLCLLCWLAYRYTTFGFSVSVTGGNSRTARAMGLGVGRLMLITVFIGGAAAGLAGTFEVAAVHGRANESLVAGYGYAGILVAFLARHNPLAIIPVAIFIGGIEAAGGLLQRSFGLPDATVLVLQGIVFLTLLVSETLRGRIGALIPRRRA